MITQQTSHHVCTRCYHISLVEEKPELLVWVHPFEPAQTSDRWKRRSPAEEGKWKEFQMWHLRPHRIHFGCGNKGSEKTMFLSLACRITLLMFELSIGVNPNPTEESCWHVRVAKCRRCEEEEAQQTGHHICGRSCHISFAEKPKTKIRSLTMIVSSVFLKFGFVAEKRK